MSVHIFRDDEPMRLDAYGFPWSYLTRQKRTHGFETGDMVTSSVTREKKIGQYWDRLPVRASGSFNIQTPQGVVEGIPHRYCEVAQRADGYGYPLVAKTDVTGTPPQPGPLCGPRSASPA